MKKKGKVIFKFDLFLIQIIAALDNILFDQIAEQFIPPGWLLFITIIFVVRIRRTVDHLQLDRVHLETIVL